MGATLQDAIESLKKGNEAEGLATLGALIDADNDAALALGHRAWHFFNARQYEPALADYECIRELAPELIVADARLAMAECCIELGRTEAAKELLAAQTACDPLEPRLLYLMHRLFNRAIDRETYLHNARQFTPNAATPLIRSNAKYCFAPINGSVGILLYALVRNCMPDLVVEIGSFVGLSAIYMGQALKDNRRGRLHCFDLFNQSLPDHLERVREQHAVFEEYMALAGLSEFVSFHAGESAEEIGRTDFKTEAGARTVVFIDGDHTVQGVTKDFNAVARVTNRDTWIVCHDVDYLHANCAGPALLAGRIFGEGNFNLIVLPTLDQTGLAILQCKDARDVRAVRPSLRDLIFQKIYYLLGMDKPRPK